MASAERSPPPTIRARKHWLAAHSITSTLVARPCALAVMSKICYHESILNRSAPPKQTKKRATIGPLFVGAPQRGAL
jgi:hypothetical protein